MTAAVAALLLTAPARAPARAKGQDAAGGGAAAGAAPVVFHLSAVDKEGRPFEGLKPEDLRVTLEGAEQKLVSLSRAPDEPLRVVVMLDASASQERILPQAVQVAAEFAAAVVRPGRDEAAVVSFTGDATVVQGLTGDLGALRRAFAAVRFEPPAGYVAGGVIVGNPPRNSSAMRAGSTAIWDALVYVCDNVLARASPGRRAVVILTDGVDTSSRTKSDKAVERLLREGVAVYSVGFADAYSFDPVDRGGLRKVSERTGGRALFPKKEKDVPAAFRQVGQALLSSYAVGLAPQASQGEGKRQKLRVELVNPELRKQGVELAHPQGLYAGAPPPARP